ncbi:MAG: hypothetical protein HNEKOMLI_00697 [Sodalis sp. Psp]|nr:hypothetical protein [Sodalis sp. Psp]MCR3757162.1 hypothetical protein [Sodalis sp. Ppy]
MGLTYTGATVSFDSRVLQKTLYLCSRHPQRGMTGLVFLVVCYHHNISSSYWRGIMEPQLIDRADSSLPPESVAIC